MHVYALHKYFDCLSKLNRRIYSECHCHTLTPGTTHGQLWQKCSTGLISYFRPCATKHDSLTNVQMSINSNSPLVLRHAWRPCALMSARASSPHWALMEVTPRAETRAGPRRRHARRSVLTHELLRNGGVVRKTNGVGLKICCFFYFL
jgi:hypothetical protein